MLCSSDPQQLANDRELTVSRGEIAALAEVTDLLEPVNFWFNIVTPWGEEET